MSQYGTLIWIVVLFGIMWFFMIRPQQQQQKKWQNMLNQLKKGDKVITRGGFLGTITAIKDDIVTLKVAEGVEVKIIKSGIGSMQDALENKKAPDKSEKKEAGKDEK